jgi:Ca2+-binding EF-hand superfamily protein
MVHLAIMISLLHAAVVATALFSAPGAAHTHRLGELLDRAWILPRPEWAKMAIAILRDEAMDPAKGWWASGGKLHDWTWLRERFDRDRGGRIERGELPLDDAQWNVLDRDLDGVISAGDFDFSAGALRPSPARALFERLDEDSNGRVTLEELKDLFRRADSLGLGFLTQDDLQSALADRESPPRPARDQYREEEPSPWRMLLMLFSGQLGSLAEGPRVGNIAPDFRLPALDRNAGALLSASASLFPLVSLSASRGRKPVVLVFGSFT